jgi:hypothetical protein
MECQLTTGGISIDLYSLTYIRVPMSSRFISFADFSWWWTLHASSFITHLKTARWHVIFFFEQWHCVLTRPQRRQQEGEFNTLITTTWKPVGVRKLRGVLWPTLARTSRSIARGRPGYGTDEDVRVVQRVAYHSPIHWTAGTVHEQHQVLAFAQSGRLQTHTGMSGITTTVIQNGGWVAGCSWLMRNSSQMRRSRGWPIILPNSVSPCTFRWPARFLVLQLRTN